MKHMKIKRNKAQARREAKNKATKSGFIKTMVNAGMTNLLNMGVYYQNDDVEKGYACMFIAESQSSTSYLQQLLGHQESVLKKVKMEIEEGRYTTEGIIAIIFHILDTELVPYFKSNPDETSDEHYENTILFATDVYLLVELGAIKNDEFNGITYSYVNEETFKMLQQS